MFSSRYLWIHIVKNVGFPSDNLAWGFSRRNTGGLHVQPYSYDEKFWT